MHTVDHSLRHALRLLVRGRVLAITATLAACTTAPDPTRTQAMTTNTATPTAQHLNKQVIREIYEDRINTGRLDGLAELVSDDYVGPQGERGPDGFAATLTGLRTGFPDIQFTIVDLL